MTSSQFRRCPLGFALAWLCCSPLIGANYRIIPITQDGNDHRWPSINNNGDIVWSQKVGGKWQVFRRNGPATATSTGANIVAPDAPNHNYKYPVIADSGDILYLRDNNPRNNGGSDLQVVRNRSNTETIIEFSTRNLNLSLGIAAERIAGSHFGIASDGTTISYYDFTRTGQAPVRRFNVNGSAISANGVTQDFSGKDYPRLNANGILVYSTGAGVFKVPVAGGSQTRVDLAGDNGTAPSIADGTDPEVVYVKAPQIASGDITSGIVMSQKGITPPVVVHTGSWASVNKSGMIVFEDRDLVTNFRQIYLALPLVHLLDPTNDLMSGTGITTNLDLLATRGIEVDGVAADGVARVLIRIDATGFDSADLGLVGDASVVGTLMKRTGGTESATLTLTPEGAGQKFFFALFKAPKQFVRTDPAEKSRDVFLNVDLSGAGQTATVSAPIKIVRPPVLLVHGLWGSGSVWNSFGELATANLDTRFFVGRANYLSSGTLDLAAQRLYTDLIDTMLFFKRVKRVASVQINIVAHGTGATTVQRMALNQQFLNDPLFPTFGSGPVSRMVSIAGAYQGAGFANYLAEQSCVADLFANSVLLRPLWSEPTPMRGGAVEDVAECSTAMNQINDATKTTPFSIHTIVAAATPTSAQRIQNFINPVRQWICPSAPQFDMQSILGANHDLFVRQESQRGNPSFPSTATENSPVIGAVHSPPFSTFLLTDHAETADPGIAGRIIQLLDTTDTSFFLPFTGVGNQDCCNQATASVTVSVSPADAPVGAVNRTVSLAAKGPALRTAEYVWELIDDPGDPSDDPTIATFVESPTCRSQPQCIAKLAARSPGIVSIRVTLLCKTNLQRAISNIVKVAFINMDNLEITLPATPNAVTGASPVITPLRIVNTIPDFATAASGDLISVLKDSGTISVLGTNIQPAWISNQIHWSMERDPSDSVDTGEPLAPTIGGTVSFPLSKAGNFRLSAYLDINANGKFDGGEQLRILRLAIVRVELFGSTSSFSLSSAFIPLGTGPGADCVVSAVDTEGVHHAMLLQADYLLEGGGIDRKIGTAAITIGNVGNLLSDTFSVGYPVPTPPPPPPGDVPGGAAEYPGGPTPMIDTSLVINKGEEPVGGVTAFRSSSAPLELPVVTGRRLRLVSADSPQYSWCVEHTTTKNPWETSRGSNAFREFVVAFSSIFDRTYLTLNRADWTVTVKGRNDGSNKWQNDGAAISGDVSLGPVGGATVQVLGLSFVREFKMIYLP